MEQILTTVALIVGGIFSVWILFSDPIGEDGKGGQMDAALLGALVMIPLIILLIIGVVLFLPILLGIIVVLFLAYGAYLGLKWLLTREREEREERKGGEDGRLVKTLHSIRDGVRNLWNSRPSRAVRERTREATVRVRKSVKETGGKLKRRVSETVKRTRERGPKKIRETERYEDQRDERHQDSSSRSTRNTDSVRHNSRVIQERRHSDSSSETFMNEENAAGYSDKSRTSRSRTKDTQERQSRGLVSDHRDGRSEVRNEDRKSRLQKWRSALPQNWKKSGDRSSSASAENPSKQALNERNRKNRSTERSQSHDPLTNMRKIGWNTRRHLGEVYHHRRRQK